MRALLGPAALILCACGGSGSGVAAPNSDAGAGPGDAATLDPLPDTQQCPSGVGMCLSGTARTSGYTSTAIALNAALYRVFPSTPGNGGAPPGPVANELVAKDGTWAFGTDSSAQPLPPWDHYYVEVVPRFAVGNKQTSAAATRVGPLSLPGSGSGSVAVRVAPVQLDVVELGATQDSLDVELASAHLFDWVTGNETGEGATVSVFIGATPVPMLWNAAPTEPAYTALFTAATAAQNTYSITTQVPPSPAQTWTLVADAPAQTGAIVTPGTGVSVPAQEDLDVTWVAPADADYEVVQLFRSAGAQGTTSSWQMPAAYTSPQLDPPDLDHETIPATALGSPGTYLLNVAFTKANCPVTADGCVLTSLVANEIVDAE